MKENEFLEHLEKILELKKNSLNDKVILESVGWDSLSALHFIAFIDKNFSKKVDANHVSKCKKVSDLMKLCL